MDTILIADDDSVVLQLLDREFEKYKNQFKVIQVGNGEECIKILKTRPVDLLITDLQMPKVDGLEVLAYVHRLHPGLPCIIMTSYAETYKEFETMVSANAPNVKELSTKNAIRFYSKPFNAERLVESVIKLLSYDVPGGLLKGISVASFIQMIVMENKSCALEIRSPDEKAGFLYFKDGVLGQAVYDDFQDEEAAIQIISTHNPAIRFVKPPGNMKRRIRTDAIGLIIKAEQRNS
ncbi:response regulator [Desulfococcaceae bacterium HSG7]|nr:response regulator [Desulfococcaceae bacterium HSG9]MDM8554929.1 response regulator [Desulfococcaceae bacterium HSG7]